MSAGRYAVEGLYDKGWREGVRSALDAVAHRADELGRPLTSDELRKIGAEFTHRARLASGGAA